MKGMDMTEGKVLPLMVKFAVPLMLGDLFQQLYIATDSVIVGQVAGADALAAVGATTFLIKLIIGLFVGISAGAFAELIYNVGSGILRSFGDSKRPFMYLVVSSIVNIILDLILVAGLDMGVSGAALATVISQIVSAGLVIYSMVKTKAPYHLDITQITVKKELVPEILQMGLPAGLQSMIVALSNVIVQANINSAGTAAVAGFGVFNKVDGLIMLPISAIAIAAMTFTGQNYGAGKKKRIIDGIKGLFILEFLAWLIGAVICLGFGKSLFYLFTDDAEVVYYAKLTMIFDIPCYWAMASGYAMTCVIRGMGRSRAASFIFVANMCGMRQLWILFANWRQMGIQGILLSYPVSWILTLAGTLLYALYLKKIGEFNENTDKRERLFCVL